MDVTAEQVRQQTESFCIGLAEAQRADLRANGFTSGAFMSSDGTLTESYGIILKAKGRKFLYIDIGHSGAFLVEKKTGELYNIKAYGQADYNKKRKADLGNVFTADPVKVFRNRYNYL